MYPQGCDVCDHLSLFLCVADYDKLLPGARRLRQTRTLHCALRRCACAAGWSHFAQFTIAVVNRDPKKSKYSDTLHRFCKKEHDWGWKKFMDLSKVLEGFTVADTLLIKAQVQVIRERPFRPFRCLDAAYRRELVRVYLTNVEGLCRRFVDEKRDALAPLRAEAASYRAFWAGCPAKTRAALATERADVILKAVAKRFFNEKEVTSTLVMDALYCGCRALEDDGVAALEEGAPDGTGCPEAGACRVALSVAGNRVTLRGDLMTALERAAAGLDLRGAAWDDTAAGAGQQPQLPPGAQQAAAGTTLALVPAGGGGEDAGRDACERDERRLATLGRRAVELFVAAHLYGSRFEVSYREALALQRQEALIREEAEQAERAAEDRCRQSDKKARAKQRRRERKEEEEAAAAEAAAVEARAAQAAADAAAEARAVAAAARAAALAAKEAEEAKAAKAAAKAAAAARAAAAPPPPPLPAPPAPPPQAGSPSDEASSSGSESGSSSGGGGGGARQAAPSAAAATRGARQRSANGNGAANSNGEGGDLAARVRALEARLAERDAEVAQLRAELAAAREAAAPAAPPRPTPPSPKKPVPARAPAAEPARGGAKTAATAQRATEPVQPLGVAAAAAAAAAQAAAAAAAAATTPAWVAAASAPAANGHAAPPGAALPPRAPLPPAAAGSPPRPLANGAAAAAAAAPAAPAAARGAPPFPPPTVVPPAALAAAPQPPRTPAGKGAPAFGAPGGVPGDSPGLHDFPHLHMIEHLLDSSY